MKKSAKWGLGIILFCFLLLILVAILPSPKSPETQKVKKATTIEKEVVDALPAYTVLDVVKLISGGTHGDILITSFSKATPASVRESALRRIVRRGFTQVSLYCTMEAYKADMSRSYSETHPGALDEGYLGSLRDGVFRSNNVTKED